MQKIRNVVGNRCSICEDNRLKMGHSVATIWRLCDVLYYAGHCCAKKKIFSLSFKCHCERLVLHKNNSLINILSAGVCALAACTITHIVGIGTRSFGSSVEEDFTLRGFDYDEQIIRLF